MGKVRIYHLARDLGIECKQLMEFLRDLQEDVKSPSSSIDESTAEAVRRLVEEKQASGEFLPAAQKKDAGEDGVSPTGGKVAADSKEHHRKTVQLSEDKVIVKDFANLIKEDVGEVVKKLLDWGIVRPAHTPIDFELACKLAREFGYEVRMIGKTPPHVTTTTIAPSVTPPLKPTGIGARFSAPPAVAPTIPKAKKERAQEVEQVEKVEKAEKVEKVEKAVEVEQEVKVVETAKVARTAEEVGAQPTIGVETQVAIGEAEEAAEKVTEQVTELTMEPVGVGVGVGVGVEYRRARWEGVVEERMVPRPPVVTVMGHVDHGKTTLLDTIRKSNVAAQEVGQITQHIGAYEVEYKGKRITFIDTPGHEAFTALRARGAQVTDIAVLVVSAEDGVMPQTIEAINHARAAGVPIVVATNKIDRPNANPERVEHQLVQLGLVPEKWGGDTIFVPISALRGDGIEDLLEMILLVAEIQELKGDPQAPAQGVVLESKVDPLRGPMATVIVQQGTLRVGDCLVAGASYGRVRLMTDHRGEAKQEAGPSIPVSIIGLDRVPEAGDHFEQVEDVRQARDLASRHEMERRRQSLRPRRAISLEQVFSQIREGRMKEFNLVVKGDVKGSVDAIVSKLERLEHPEVKVSVIHQGVGNISESDVMLAAASNAIIIGFHVAIDSSARKALQMEPVGVKLYQIIYELIDDLKRAILGMLKPIRREEVLGLAEVRATFHIARVGVVAGCFVSSGRVVHGAHCRIRRDGQLVHEGRIASLRHRTEDRSEIPQGMECGLSVEGFSNFRVGDLIEVFTVTELQHTLDEIHERPSPLVAMSVN